MKTSKIIVSINAYNLDALETVIASCHAKIKEDFLIILNNSLELDETIKNSGWLTDKPYIICNPKPFNKVRFRGCITKGIMSNMDLAFKTISNWKYFIILSNRTGLIKDIDIPTLHKHGEYFRGISKRMLNLDDYTLQQSFVLGQHGTPFVLDLKNKQKLSIPLKYRDHLWQYQGLPPQWREQFLNKPSWGGSHEGFTMDRRTCQYILQYALRNPDLIDIAYHQTPYYSKYQCCMEEMFFHTLSLNGNGDFMPLQGRILEMHIKDSKNPNSILENASYYTSEYANKFPYAKQSYSYFMKKHNINPLK